MLLGLPRCERFCRAVQAWLESESGCGCELVVWLTDALDPTTVIVMCRSLLGVGAKEKKKGKTDTQPRTHTCSPVMSTDNTQQKMAHQTCHGFVWPCYGTCWAMRTSFDFDYDLGKVSFDDASNIPYDGTEEKTATHGLGWLLRGLLLPTWSLSC